MDIITSYQLYWLTRCDEIKALIEPGFGFALFWFLSTVVLILSTFVRVDTEGSPEGSENYKIYKLASNGKRISMPLCIIFSALILVGETVSALIPTTKEIAAIVVIPAVANSESVQGLGEGIVNLAKNWMDELSPKKVSNEEVKNMVVETVDAAVKTAKTVSELSVKEGDKNVGLTPAEK